MSTTSIKITRDPLSIDTAYSFLQHPHSGGISLFVGTTRQWTEERETVELEYDGYVPLAEKELRRLAGEAMQRWPVLRVCLHHRLGIVPVSEASVIVGVATPHRKDAFAACRFLIDALKKQVPIWKREVYADGDTEWVEGTAPPEVEGRREQR